MDNTIIPYEDDGSSSSEEDFSDSSSNDQHSHLLSNNLGVHFNNFSTDQSFMNMEDPKEYAKEYATYFSPKISRHTILINSLSHTHDSNNYDFTVDLDDEGHGSFKDVIGFRLIKAGIPNRDYQITDSNKKLSFTFGGVAKEALLTAGSYTGDTMASALTSNMNSISGVSGISVTFNDITLKFKFTSLTAIGLDFSAEDGDNLHIILGFNHEEVPSSTSITSTNIPDFSIHYVDIVIDEIPYIACKRNSSGKHIIDRIGLYSPIGTMNYYENKYLLHQNFFTPIILSQLSIQVLDDHGSSYHSGETEMFFEFEITVMNYPL